MPAQKKTRVLASRCASVTVPELEQKAAVLSTLASAHSRRSYKHASISTHLCSTLPYRAEANSNRFSFCLVTAPVQTTERYIGCRQNFREAVNDRFRISL